ncbi:restriction endonuclease [Nitratireductor sp. OM-1]|uniref:restriction endonuclease n=1 Tax=Nitratireductor sp. OM-1 TaxID=1756988 RepID=UPI000DDC6421|nr:restriction endonuclease [Nitratireductor sp. OM-1]
MVDSIKSVDLKLIADLFGDGYVMDFTNATYADFFRDDVGIEIYDDVYSDNGNSKGKRLRTFMQKGQRAAILKALPGLWEWRVGYLAKEYPGQADTVPQALDRLNALIERLGGTRIGSAQAKAAVSPSAPAAAKPSGGVLAALEQEFLALMAMDEQPHRRGLSFERFLKKWFDVWGLDPNASFATKSEQIDGSFHHDSTTYIIEAKWHTKPTNGAMLHAFQGKLQERPDWTRGLYVSYGGYSDQSFDAFTAKRLIMMDGTDIYHALNRQIDVGEVIRRKVRRHSEHRQPFARVTDLFPS